MDHTFVFIIIAAAFEHILNLAILNWFEGHYFDQITLDFIANWFSNIVALQFIVDSDSHFHDQ